SRNLCQTNTNWSGKKTISDFTMITLEAYFDYVILPILSISVMLIFIRLLKGPAVVGRVVALDLIITTGIGIITVYAIRSNQAVFSDVAIALRLVAVVDAVADAYST